jgi:N-methylhydantoinase B
LGEETTLVTFGDGVKPGSEAFGLNGGQAGCLNRALLTYPDGRTQVPKSKELVRGVPRGAMLRQVAGGGGGFGDPKLRSRSKIREEVEDGVISPEAAERLYGLEG